MRQWLRYWRGRARLRLGFCPACDSSPPNPTCAICDGTSSYGPQLTDERRRMWADRWEAWSRWRQI